MSVRESVCAVADADVAVFPVQNAFILLGGTMTVMTASMHPSISLSIHASMHLCLFVCVDVWMCG